jgi:hypothetical protein
MRRKPTLSYLTMAVLALSLCCGCDAAEVRVSGTQDHIVIQANDSTILEILAALRSTFDLKVTFMGTTARTFTGAYSGSARQVLLRLLAGEDYLISSDSEGISIVLIGKSAGDNTARWSSLPPTVPSARPDAPRQQPSGGAIVK